MDGAGDLWLSLRFCSWLLRSRWFVSVVSFWGISRSSVESDHVGADVNCSYIALEVMVCRWVGSVMTSSWMAMGVEESHSLLFV